MLTAKSVSQENPMGCAVACVAACCQLQYKEALQLFTHPENAWTRGYYCQEVVQALARAGFHYIYEKFDFEKHIQIILKPGTIVFIERNSKYIAGHYLLRLEKGWMNPWSNFPHMMPVESAIELNLPGPISYVIYEKKI